MAKKQRVKRQKRRTEEAKEGEREQKDKKANAVCHHHEHFILNALGDIDKHKNSSCTSCSSRARWLCLRCRVPLCGKGADHLSVHHRADATHAVFANIRTGRVFCQLCDEEISPVESTTRTQDTRELRVVSVEQSSSAVAPLIPTAASNRTRGRPVEREAVQSRPLLVSIEDERDDVRPKGLSGLYNLGNTCYANAALQALNNCPPFSDFFRLKGSLSPHANTHPYVSNAFAQLIQNMWRQDRLPVVHPGNLLMRIREQCPQFSGFAQQDSQELIRCVLELIHREMGRPVYAHEEGRRRQRRWSSSSSSTPSETVEAVDSGWSSDGDTAISVDDEVDWRPIRTRSIVSDIFDGKMESAVRCLTCHNLSTTTETFEDLSLPIVSPDLPSTSADEEMLDESWLDGWYRWFRSFSSWLVPPSVSLEECFSSFFQPDRLIGDDMYSCEKCKKLRNGVKTCRITRLPEVLVVHLKRFHHDHLSTSKISTRVTFPLCDLSMSPWAADDAGINQYDLCAFVCHEGVSVDCGHYIAVVRNEIDGNWYELDDTMVTKLDPGYVLTKEPYVLFYQKKQGDKQEKIRQRVREMLSPSFIARNPPNERFYISSCWLEKLSTCAEPGPISNFDFLCAHGHVLPRRAPFLSSLCTQIPSPLWEYLAQTFGGGPAVSSLHYCAVCEKRAKTLAENRVEEVRRLKELEKKLAEESASGDPVLYSYHFPPNVIPRAWFESWEKFINDSSAEPPGPIDTAALLSHSADGTTRLRMIRSLFISVPREMFLFFHRIYGGGPEVFATEQPQPTEDELVELIRTADWAIEEARAAARARNEKKHEELADGARVKKEKEESVAPPPTPEVSPTKQEPIETVDDPMGE